MKILLLGDYCNDIFVEGDTVRLSPERPVPVFERRGAEVVPGMAGNVLANIQSLCPGALVTSLMGNSGAKIRFVDRKTGHHFMRLDEPLEAKALDLFDLEKTFEAGLEWDAVVVSDYAKGFLNDLLMDQLSGLCAQYGTPLFADTKRLIRPWAQCAIVKINEHEYAEHIRKGVFPKAGSLIVTRGGDGMDLLDKDGKTAYHVHAEPIEVKDGAGCGDSVLAALVVGYIENGRDLRKAMDWAGKVGAVAVSKRGVVAVKREEVA